MTIALNALNIAESLFGINHPRVFEIKSYLPLVKSALGKNETALGLAEELLQFWKDFKSPEHHMVGIFQGLIGQINTWMGNFEKADEAFTKGIDVLKKSPTTDTDILGGAWCWAAMSPLMSERYEKAVYLLNQGLNTQFQLKFFTQWLCHFYLGLAYGGQHQWPLAENHMKKALRLTKEGIGEITWIAAMSSISMAAIYYDQKKEIEALPLAKDGIEFLENRLQPTYQGPVFLLDQLIAGYQILGQHDKMNAL